MITKILLERLRLQSTLVDLEDASTLVSITMDYLGLNPDLDGVIAQENLIQMNKCRTCFEGIGFDDGIIVTKLS